MGYRLAISDLEYLGKAKGFMSFKEQEQARLLKHMVVPASELAARKQAEIDRAKEFTRSSEDESFYARTEPSVTIFLRALYPYLPARAFCKIG